MTGSSSTFTLRVMLWRIAGALAMFIGAALAVRLQSVWFFLAGIIAGYVNSVFIQRMLTRCPHCGALAGRFQKMTWAQRSLTPMWWVPIEKPADHCNRCHKAID